MATKKTSRWEELCLVVDWGGRRYIVVCGGESFGCLPASKLPKGRWKGIGREVEGKNDRSEDPNA